MTGDNTPERLQWDDDGDAQSAADLFNDQDDRSEDHSDDDGEGISLDALSQAYAELVDGGNDPYQPPPANAREAEQDQVAAISADLLGDEATEEAPRDQDDACDLSPRSILEAILFVGHPNNEPLTSSQIASLMRGVRAEEIDELVIELNAFYRDQNAAYEVVPVGEGYNLQLRESLSPVRERFYGRVKDAKLSQAAIEVLSLVAYSQPVTKKQVDASRGKPSGALLNQLVRRELLELQRDETASNETGTNKKSKKGAEPSYVTTQRFLDLFSLDNVNDLPHSQDIDRM